MKIINIILTWSYRFIYSSLVPSTVSLYCFIIYFYTGHVEVFIVGLLNLLIGISKFFEYLSVKKALSKYGFRENIVKTKSYSWCQRHVTTIACNELGHGQKWKDYKLKNNHKFWHILPKFRRFKELNK